jgi:hypothetical protein
MAELDHEMLADRFSKTSIVAGLHGGREAKEPKWHGALTEPSLFELLGWQMKVLDLLLILIAAAAPGDVAALLSHGFADHLLAMLALLSELLGPPPAIPSAECRGCAHSRIMDIGAQVGWRPTVARASRSQAAGSRRWRGLRPTVPGCCCCLLATSSCSSPRRNSGATRHWAPAPMLIDGKFSTPEGPLPTDPPPTHTLH